MIENTPVDIETLCRISGNDDIYGLGVRLGIYFQWVTSILVENVDRAEIPATRAAGNCYQIAMLAGLIRISQYPSDKALALEGYIVLLFCFVGVWASSIGLQGRFSKRSGPGEPSETVTAQQRNQAVGFGPLISISLSITTSAYGTWYLFSGINHMARSKEACDEIIFFFSKVKLFGWVLIILKICFILSLVGSAVMLAYQVYDIAQNFGVLLDEWQQAPTQASLVLTNSSHGKVTIGTVKLIGSILAMAIFIVSIEMTLMWNHIGDVYSCNSFSQVFSLVVGASVCMRIAVNLCKMVVVKDIELIIKW